MDFLGVGWLMTCFLSRIFGVDMSKDSCYLECDLLVEKNMFLPNKIANRDKVFWGSTVIQGVTAVVHPNELGKISGWLIYVGVDTTLL